MYSFQLKIIFFYHSLWELYYFSAGITLSVLPSSKVTVNQSVILLCELETYLSPPFNVSFVLVSPSLIASNVCTLELSSWECMNTTYLWMNLYYTIQHKGQCSFELEWSVCTMSNILWNEQLSRLLCGRYGNDYQILT